MGDPHKATHRFKHKTYFKVKKLPAFGARATAAVAGTGPWRVPDLCKAYNWPTNLAGGGVIAIVQLGGGWVQSDMDTFFKSVGQPSPHIVDVSVDATKNNPNQSVGAFDDPDLEVALDIQVAGASYFAATGKAANIRVYWSQSIETAVQKAAEDGCAVCSISWGADEALWGPDAVKRMESVAEAATNMGMVVVGATGDNDSSDGGPTPANVDAPASCPHVVACGGTSKTAATETVWNNNPGTTDGHGTGGGYSTVFPVQAFQIGAPPAGSNSQPGSGRMVPDVCANADPSTGYTFFVHGATAEIGGTSAVAPLYAGLFASFGTKLGYITPKLWQNQGAFNDVTQGSNGMYDALPGPDACSGIGSPIGTRIAALFGAKS
jgi:kumamolisin